MLIVSAIILNLVLVILFIHISLWSHNNMQLLPVRAKSRKDGWNNDCYAWWHREGGIRMAMAQGPPLVAAFSLLWILWVAALGLSWDSPITSFPPTQACALDRCPGFWYWYSTALSKKLNVEGRLMLFCFTNISHLGCPYYSPKLGYNTFFKTSHHFVQTQDLVDIKYLFIVAQSHYFFFLALYKKKWSTGAMLLWDFCRCDTDDKSSVQITICFFL